MALTVANYRPVFIMNITLFSDFWGCHGDYCDPYMRAQIFEHSYMAKMIKCTIEYAVADTCTHVSAACAREFMTKTEGK